MKYFSVRNRAIVSELVRSDFKIRYQGSVLGYAWSLLRPLLLFSVLYVIFVYIIPIGNSVEHFPVYLLTGIILWNFFAEATGQGLTSVVARGDIIRKINIPKYLIVVSSTVSALINLLFGLVVLMFFAFASKVYPSWDWIMLVFVILELFVLALSISFLLSSLYVKFRDVSYIWEVFLQIGFYASAIIFPLSSAPLSMQKWFFLNPIVQIVQDARYIISTKTTITIWSNLSMPRIVVPFAILAFLIVIGSIVFKARSRTFAEDI